jgi:hypothetical protein
MPMQLEFIDVKAAGVGDATGLVSDKPLKDLQCNHSTISYEPPRVQSE